MCRRYLSQGSFTSVKKREGKAFAITEFHICYREMSVEVFLARSLTRSRAMEGVVS